MRLLFYSLGFIASAGLLGGCQLFPASSQPRDAAAIETSSAVRSVMTGRASPYFSLPDEHGKPRAITDYRGKWIVLYFYPKDDTPGCVCQATEFTALLKRFNSLNATVLGVSNDTPNVHWFFRNKYNLRFTLLSDRTVATMRRYGAWVDTPSLGSSSGRVIRSTFLIDPTGTIAWHWPEVIPQGHAERVRAKLVQLQQGTAPRAAVR